MKASVANQGQSDGRSQLTDPDRDGADDGLGRQVDERARD